MKKSFVDSCAENFVDSSKEISDAINWKPRYEWAGIWARRFIKNYFSALIIYGFWGLIFSFAYLFGGYPSLIISVSVSIIYSIRFVGNQLKGN